MIDWFFRDRRTGAIVIGQWPNLPLWLFALTAGAVWVSEALSLPVPSHGRFILYLVAMLCLAWWALDEIIRGVNPWRRCLGGAMLLIGLWTLVRQT